MCNTVDSTVEPVLKATSVKRLPFQSPKSAILTVLRDHNKFRPLEQSRQQVSNTFNCSTCVCCYYHWWNSYSIYFVFSNSYFITPTTYFSCVHISDFIYCITFDKYLCKVFLLPSKCILQLRTYKHPNHLQHNKVKCANVLKYSDTKSVKYNVFQMNIWIKNEMSNVACRNMKKIPRPAY